MSGPYHNIDIIRYRVAIPKNLKPMMSIDCTIAHLIYVPAVHHESVNSSWASRGRGLTVTRVYQ